MTPGRRFGNLWLLLAFLAAAFVGLVIYLVFYS
jgi:hypothetical protein